MENYLDQEQIILELFELLFKDFGVHRITIETLADLINEFNLLKILQEIEPELLIVTEMEDISLLKESSEDSKKENLKIRNFKEIIKCLTIYFDNYPDKSKLNSDFNLTKLVDASNLIVYDNENLIKLGEILLVLSALSSKMTEYLDTLAVLSETDTKYMNSYMNILEKYLNFDQEETGATPNTLLRKTTIKRFNYERKASFKKRMTIRNKENFQFVNNMEALEKDIENLNVKNEELTNDLLELEMKYRDVMRENESLKKNINQHYQLEEESYNDAVTITNLKNELMKKELEIEEIKKDHDLYLKRLKEDLAKMNMVKESLEDRLEEFKSIKFENDKLKLRIKELNLNKDKLNSYDNMVIAIEGKNKQIECLIKEKQSLILQTEKLIKENQADKEKLKEIEYEKKKIEYELYDMRSEIRTLSRRSTLQRGGNFEKDISKIQFQTNIHQSGFILDQLQDNSVINNEEFLNNFEKVDHDRELADIRQELEEMKTMYKQQIEINQKLIEANSDSNNINEKLKLDMHNLNSEKDKIIIEKEKLEINKQKIELELNKIQLVIDKIETEKLKLIDEVHRLKNKIEQLVGEKTSQQKEIETLKFSLKQKTNMIQKLKTEKQMLESEVVVPGSFVSNEGTKTSASSARNLKVSSKNSVNQSINPSPKHSLNSEVNELKVEVSRLKTSSISKDEQIKQLKERIKHLEKLEGIIKSRESKKESDLQYYKKSFEDQKKRLNNEHEIISNNLCELANKFVIFKNELLKNVKPTILQQNNISN